MARPAKHQAELTPIPLLRTESLYIGIDIGKDRHVAGFVSTTLLARHERFEACPALSFENSREGFHALIERIQSLAPLEHCFVLLERTGHYQQALRQYLQELDLPVYLIHVQSRPVGLLKTDKRDALGLANHLFNQLERGIQVGNKTQLVRRLTPPTPAAAQLKGLIRHRYELIQESTQRKNKLTALCDELFPEFARVCPNPNASSALALRAAFPTPHVLATASLSALQQTRKGHHPSNAKLLELQHLAAASIGTKDVLRQRGLVLEQSQLIQELLLIQAHVEQLEAEISTIITQAREGQILLSMGLGVVQVAAILATIGSIHNFKSAAALKAYFGWAPKVTQSGKTLDHTSLTPGGNRVMKHMMYWIVASAIQQHGSEWASLYARLVQAKCPYDERTGSRTGRKRVMGRIAGQMIEVMYALLKRDAEILYKTPPGKAPPPPGLYDPALHRQHRAGHYHPSTSTPAPQTILLLPQEP
jgi:transposase